MAITVDAGFYYDVVETYSVSLSDASITGGGGTLNWTIESGGTGSFDNAALINPVFTPDDEGAYVLKATSSEEPGQSDKVLVNVAPLKVLANDDSGTDYVTTPHTTDLTQNNSMEVIADIQPFNIADTAAHGIVNKGDNGWKFFLQNGNLVFKVDAAVYTSTAQISATYSSGDRFWVKMDWDDTSNLVSFYHSNNSGDTWTQLGTSVATTGSVPTNTEVLTVGNISSTPTSNFYGNIYRVRFYDAKDGNLIADCFPAEKDKCSLSGSWTGSDGRVYTATSGIDITFTWLNRFTGTQYYVDNVAGSNGANGLTPGTAWATMAYAEGQISAGDTVNLIDNGVQNPYREYMDFSTAGTAANPKILRGPRYTGAHITALETLTGWTDNAGIWECVTSTITELFICTDAEWTAEGIEAPKFRVDNAGLAQGQWWYVTDRVRYNPLPGEVLANTHFEGERRTWCIDADPYQYYADLKGHGGNNMVRLADNVRCLRCRARGNFNNMITPGSTTGGGSNVALDDCQGLEGRNNGLYVARGASVNPPYGSTVRNCYVNGRSNNGPAGISYMGNDGINNHTDGSNNDTGEGFVYERNTSSYCGEGGMDFNSGKYHLARDNITYGNLEAGVQPGNYADDCIIENHTDFNTDGTLAGINAAGNSRMYIKNMRYYNMRHENAVLFDGSVDATMDNCININSAWSTRGLLNTGQNNGTVSGIVIKNSRLYNNIHQSRHLSMFGIVPDSTTISFDNNWWYTNPVYNTPVVIESSYRSWAQVTSLYGISVTNNTVPNPATSNRKLFDGIDDWASIPGWTPTGVNYAICVRCNASTLDSTDRMIFSGGGNEIRILGSSNRYSARVSVDGGFEDVTPTINATTGSTFQIKLISSDLGFRLIVDDTNEASSSIGTPDTVTWNLVASSSGGFHGEISDIHCLDFDDPTNCMFWDMLDEGVDTFPARDYDAQLLPAMDMTMGVGTIYYVNNSTGDNGYDGLTTNQAWATMTYALLQLSAGDTLNVMETGSTYDWDDIRSTDGHSSGTSDNPITVQAYSTDNPVVTFTGNNRRCVGLSWWIFDGLTFNDCYGIDHENITDWVYRNCTFEHHHHGSFGWAIRLWDQVHRLTCEDSLFDNLRSRVLGIDFTAFYTPQRSTSVFSDITVQRCTFRDIGADGIQSESSATSTNWIIQDNLFEIIRPYQYREPVTGNPAPDPDGWINVGENGVDIKDGQDYIIQRNTFRGFRPCDGALQDGSGASSGLAMVIHIHPSNEGHMIRRNWFEDCSAYFTVNGGTQAINGVKEISNNIFGPLATDGADFASGYLTPVALRFRDYSGTCKIENNTFYNDTSLPYRENPEHIQIDEDAIEADNLTIRNNIFEGGYIRLRNNANPTGLTADYNMWVDQSQARPSMFVGTNDQTPANSNINTTTFMPESNSAARDNGVDAGYGTDYYGTAITAFDIGAVQYDAPPATAPFGIIDVDLDNHIFDGQTNVLVRIDTAISATGKKVWISQGSNWVEQSVVGETTTSVTIDVTYAGVLNPGAAKLYVRNPL